jgi:hypothetical protein
LFLGVKSHAQTVQTAGKSAVEEKTNAVATRLKLSDDKRKSVYNVFSQIEKRIADLAIGTPDYARLIGYINQERTDMLKVALSPEEYTLYQKFYGISDKREIDTFIRKNNAYLTKKAANEAKEKRTNERLMQADKQKAKRDAEKQKLADKKAAEKQKALERKQKELDKKLKKK